jgi:hypothetical protein
VCLFFASTQHGRFKKWSLASHFLKHLPPHKQQSKNALGKVP